MLGGHGLPRVVHFSEHKDVKERFLREGYVANKVGHPGAVQVLDEASHVTVTQWGRG